MSVLPLVIDLLHAVMVLSLSARLDVAILFFLFSSALVLGRRLAPVSRLYLTLAICALTFVLLLLRQTPFLMQWGSTWPGFAGASLRRISQASIRTLGLSYCYLRVVYALVSRTDWTAPGFFRYYFCAPTFFSGPVLAPETALRSQTRFDKAALAFALTRWMNGVIRIAAALILMRMVPLALPGAALQAAAWPTPLLWIGVFASGVWLYLNFSGYSEIYIGFAHLLGVQAPENFDNPFGASTITGFWQRWHISLGNWLRAMVYTPLSRGLLATSTSRLIASLLLPAVTMLVCGAWHAVTASFLLWGLFHGVGLALHASWTQFAHPLLSKTLRGHFVYRSASWTLTHAYVALAWIFFLPVAGIGYADRLRLFEKLVGFAQ